MPLMKLYCFDSEFGDDPHAVILELDAGEYQEYRDAQPKRPARYEVGTYVTVTDHATGKRWKVASHPCGLGCHCAAVALPAEGD